MPKRRLAGAFLAGFTGSASLSFAQSVSIDEKKEPAEATVAVVPKTAVAPRPEPITPPVAIATPVEYPEGGQGAQAVVLELTISKTGTVTYVTAVSGEPLFAARAVEAAKNWTFVAARRAEQPVAAKIRFLVKFTAPAEELALDTTNTTEPRREKPKSKSENVSGETATYEVIVQGQREPIRHQLGSAEIRDMPGAFGDPFRAIEALPGVVPIASGLPYFYVRGAPPGNVGYFFDGIPVPYLYHFAAGPGVLHPAFVDHVDLYPGAYPARYGRFAGAIVAGEMAPPSERVRGEASIRLIDSGAMLETPFAEGRGSLMLGGRYSYTGLVISLIDPKVSLNYWDYQVRAGYAIDAHNRLEVLAFGSGDFLSNQQTTDTLTVNTGSGISQNPTFSTSVHDETLVDVGFHRLDMRWDRKIPRGNWRQAVMLGLDRTYFDDEAVIVTNHLIGARSEFEQRTESGLDVHAGADILFESLAQKADLGVRGSTVSDSQVPSSVTNNSNSNAEADFGLDRARKDFTAGAYADVVVDVARHVQVTPGLRFDLFASGSRVVPSIDPRITARYQLSKKLSVTHGFAVAHQAPSFVAAVPGLKPSLAGGLQTAVQSSAGVTYLLPADFVATATLFQNDFFNMTDYVSLLQLANTTSQGSADTRSLGHAYGAELMVRRSLARDLGGFVSYTLSRSLRSSGQLQGPALSDRTHVLNVAASYNLGRNWRIGGRWLYYTGIPVRVAYLDAAKTPPRTPPFWRLDFKLQKRWIIAPPNVWWGLVLEVLNTTLNKESLSGSCDAYRCVYDSIGPVTVPSIGAEGAF